MSLSNDLPRGFVKHVVRNAHIVARQVANATATGTHHNTTAEAAKKSHAIERQQTSSLEAPVVAIILGGFILTFIFFVLIGVTCKYANRPKTAARPQIQSKGMYQPSAAGYGSQAASYTAGGYRGDQSMHDVSSPNVGLLDSAQPMGRGGRYEEADNSLGSSDGLHNANGGYGMAMAPSRSASSFSGDENQRFAPSRGGHARGASSGIELPASAASATFRRNVSGSHPPIHHGSDDSYDSPHKSHGVMPDGSGFTPGQVFDYNAVNGGAPKGTNEMREARNSYLGGPPAVLPRRSSVNMAAPAGPQPRPYPRGPPPASSKNRRSRYTQNMSSSADTSAMRRSRIDSVGPGTYRKSMFMSQEDQDSMPGSGFAGGSQMRRTTSNNNDRAGAGPRPLRRVESIGKGDPRRTSRFQGSNAASRMSMMVPEEDAHVPATSPGGYRDGLPTMSGNGLMPGGPGGWDSGQRSPYGGSSNGSNSPLGPLGPNDPMLTMQQQQQQFMQQQPPPHMQGGGVRMMNYGAGFGAPMPRPGMTTAQISSPSSFAQAAPLGAGFGRIDHTAASRQIL